MKKITPILLSTLFTTSLLAGETKHYNGEVRYGLDVYPCEVTIEFRDNGDILKFEGLGPTLHKSKDHFVLNPARLGPGEKDLRIDSSFTGSILRDGDYKQRRNRITYLRESGRNYGAGTYTAYTADYRFELKSGKISSINLSFTENDRNNLGFFHTYKEKIFSCKKLQLID